MEIEISDQLAIDDAEIRFDYIQSSGPGGQNVNKVATAVQLRFDVRRSPSLPEDIRSRLERLAGKRVSEDGVLIIEARRYRSQEHNRQDAIDRLVALIRKAAEKPKLRKRTRPTAEARQKRLEEKRRRGNIKRLRREVVE
jgi:ribosome-associated protein